MVKPVPNILIGPAGLGSPPNKGLERCVSLGCTVAEIPFTRSIFWDNQTSEKVGKLAKEMGVSLTVHAPYFVNLVSLEHEKVLKSRERILLSCERAQHMGASKVVFHAAFMQGRELKEVYPRVKAEILGLQESLLKEGFEVQLAPEVTGKHSEFGDLQSLLKLKQETGCSICVDFAHLKARLNGEIDYSQVFDLLKDEKSLHCHYAGIAYTQKGEKNHLPVDQGEFSSIIKAARLSGLDSVSFICEAPPSAFEGARQMLDCL